MEVLLALLFAGFIQIGNFQETENVVTENGYHFKYKTADSERSENGMFDPSKEENGIIVSGYYSFVGTDGKTYKVEYVADENGYRATVTSGEGPKAQPKISGRPVAIVPYVGSALLGSLIGGGIG